MGRTIRAGPYRLATVQVFSMNLRAELWHSENPKTSKDSMPGLFALFTRFTSQQLDTVGQLHNYFGELSSNIIQL